MLHMIKLAVTCTGLQDLRQWLAQQKRAEGLNYVPTWLMPKRTEDLLGGSVYRVINGLILGRQPITGFETVTRPDGRKGTRILVTGEVIAVQPTPRKAFQGWRYLRPEDAPPDLQPGDAQAAASLPPDLQRRLAELGIL
ncbi:DUF1489 family protein [Oecophyllibacter saccharovorans]|nr:DUF1489 domain-containing protein [Oecophyllibacter saccharovorans]QDH15465.1 DUF1489 family protein [Oecophyllibacter saccharovorans]